MTFGWIAAQVGSFSLRTEWSVAPGEVHVLFGPSGSGKTTTLRAIAGLIRPSEGHIEVGARVVFDAATRVWLPPHQRRVGYVPQDWLLFPHLDVAQNIGYGLRGLPAHERGDRVRELTARMGLSGLERRKVWQLSGGQQQRAAVARALASGPRVLLLDEPFSALDIETRRQVRNEVKQALHAAGVPVVLVTHDREEAIAMGDSVSVLDAGTTVAKGAPLAVLGHPGRERVARLVGVENLLNLTVSDVAPQDGVMHCEQGAFTLEVPLADAKTGDQVTIGLRADDILLASSAPQHISARNVIGGTVTSIQPEGPAYAVEVDCGGVALQCHVTRRAIEQLGIDVGKRTWVVVKTSSCTVLAD